MVRFLSDTRIFSLPPKLQTVSGALAAFYLSGTWSSFPVSKLTRVWSWPLPTCFGATAHSGPGPPHSRCF